MDPLALALGAAGALLGFVADRLATRWPEHDEEHPAGRSIDWRTLACIVVGAVAFALLPARFTGDPLALALFGAWFVTLVIGLATDLDQRDLPDELTLPVIPVALIFAISGRNPLVAGDLVWAVVAALAIPAVLYLPSLFYGAGAFGIGDVKLLVGVGLMLGGAAAVSGVFVAFIVTGLTLGVLLLTRRIGRRTYVPLGPFLIIGAMWAVLLRP